ncbi:MAG TPA: BofC C-terminal domain-containing protein [Negativicutes bacterium]|nr:BofC C-terminal domain-containing protein [Negativicutes bacterium]
MFEDRSIRRRRRYLLVMVVVLLAGAAFGVGYFFNAESPEAFQDPNDPGKVTLQIPDSLINPKPSREPMEQVNADSTEDTEVSSRDKELLTPNTQLIFKTTYSSCGHSIEKSVQASKDEINMNAEQLKEKYPTWELTAFSPPVVEMSRRIDAYCPGHYIIGQENGYITIYVYDENGNKVVQERTEITIATLTPEDQQALQAGIVADTEDQKEQTIEGFSD